MISNATSSKKQATKGQKQVHEENLATVKYYGAMVAVSASVYFVLTYLMLGASNYEWIAYWLTVSSQVGSVVMMYKMAGARKNEKGQIIDAGLDLNLEGGFGEYCKDVIILASVVELLSMFWAKFWFLMALIPLFAGYKLWVGLLSPYFFASAPEEEESDDKKAKKRDRKMRRMQQQ